MYQTPDNYLSNIRKGSTIQHSIQQISILLSLLVIWGVFWSLKLTGITLAGEAFCGIDEHEHSELCAHP